MEELIELLHKIKFTQTKVCSCKRKSSNKIEDFADSLYCNTCVKTYFEFDEGNEALKVYIDDTKSDFIKFEITHLDESIETSTILLKDIKEKFYKHPLIKPLVTKSKIKSINKMNENSLMEKYITEYRNLLKSLGFKLVETGSTHSDIYILNTDEIHYRIIVNNIDTDYSNSEKIEIESFNKITQKRRGLNWHVQSSSVRQAIDKFFYYLPKLKSLVRKNKIEKILS